MTKGNPVWEQFEHEVQDLLDLRSTPGSGNQWHDVSDGRSRPEDSYKIMVDCKYTEKGSYSLASRVLQNWWNVATELGYHFAMPIKIGGMEGKQKDWVAIPLNDYAELVDAIRIMNGSNRCGLRFSIHDVMPCCRKIGHLGHHDNGEKEWSA